MSGVDLNGHDFLRETAAVLTRGWCCGADARDCLGAAVAASDPAATAWSLTGALALVSDRPDASLRALGDALWGISGVIPDRSLDEWNDAAGRTQADALNLLARASVSLYRDMPPDGAAAG